MEGQECLPGSNNQHTEHGRRIDTWDREFNGRDGSGCYEETEHVDLSKLTLTGYRRDDFVVEDHDIEYSSDNEISVVSPIHDDTNVTTKSVVDKNTISYEDEDDSDEDEDDSEWVPEDEDSGSEDEDSDCD